MTRAKGFGERPHETVTIHFEGEAIEARRGETVAAALASAGHRVFRRTLKGDERGLFCGMGTCQECLVTVDGVPNRRACMTLVDGPADIRVQAPLPSPQLPAQSPAQAVEHIPDVLVVGAGPAGLAAAVAAGEAGADVMVLDERPGAGGQYFKQPASFLTEPGEVGRDRQFERGRRLIERARAAGATIIGKAEIWGAFAPRTLMAKTDDASLVIRPKTLVVATGAYERVMPLPGWTLPGVMTTGAAQTLLRSYRTLPGRSVLIAGNGPLNIQVALELARAGSEVRAVAEAAEIGIGRAAALARMAVSSPSLCLEGAGYLLGLRRHGIPLHSGERLLEVEARAGGGLVARLGRWRAGRAEPVREIEADIVCLGYGFLPANEILRLLGVRHDYDAARGSLVVPRDDDCLTSLDRVYAVGDCCGRGGASVAIEEGTIAGLAAAASLGHGPVSTATANAARRRRDRHRRFQAALWRYFASPLLTTELCRADTLVCRCEDVTFGDLSAALDDDLREIGSLKRFTRAGMGRCQARNCAATIAAMVAARSGEAPGETSFFAPRPPIKPVAIADVAAGARHFATEDGD